MGIRIITGDCREMIKALPDRSVHCCVTSPPYFGLRDYGVDGQIGLEQTPDEYVAEMVAVFREVRRVLRDDGTLWLNLGDSYAAQRGGTHQPAETLAGGHGGKTADGSRVNRGRHDGYNPTRNASAIGLKHKDLIGIPWRVAFALQQPYYTGRIKDERDRIWLAAMIDAEGCMFIHKRKAGTGNHSAYTKKDGTVSHYSRTQDTYGAGLEVANTSEAVVARCQQITGVGSICRQDKDRRQPLYRWNVRSNECRWIVEEVYPYLVAKQHQARLLLGCPSSGKDAERAHGGLIALHNGSETDIDFKPPAPLFQPGFYLRQDLIWSKLNPMPESVKDRCTKAHEYIFLLSKSPKYYFDAEAIKEPASYNGPPKPGKQAQTAYTGLRTHTGQLGMSKDGKRNCRSVWTVATEPFREAHFAVFPPSLIEPCILAGCPEGGTVLDPFGGAGTTALCADRLNRNAILIELNPEYVQIARKRLTQDAGMFAEVAA